MRILRDARHGAFRTIRRKRMNKLENVRQHLKVTETDNTIKLTIELVVSKNNGWIQLNGTPMNAIGRQFFVSWAAACRNVMQHLEVFALDHLYKLPVVNDPISMRTREDA